jgi:hypothetical protein
VPASSRRTKLNASSIGLALLLYSARNRTSMTPARGEGLVEPSGCVGTKKRVDLPLSTHSVALAVRGRMLRENSDQRVTEVDTIAIAGSKLVCSPPF